MMVREIALRKNWFATTPAVIETIYFGGGTPSVLEISDLNLLIEAIQKHFQVVAHPEITVEANPDDLTPSYLEDLSKTSVNRLSVGVQSFFDDD